MIFSGYTPKYLVAKFFKKMRLSSVINSSIHKTAKVESGTSFISSSMGRYSFCGYDCDMSLVDIGAFTSIASGVVIGGARHPMEWVSMSPVFYRGRDSVRKKFAEHSLDSVGRVLVGNDVWIGRSATVLPGVSIGNGAVIGASAVVTKNIPPYAIVVGNPARIIRYRFNDEVIKKLEGIQWWNLSDEELESLAYVFNDMDSFLLQFK